MNILVFCSAQDVPEKYNKSASEFAKLIAQNGHTLIWGGTDRGLMKVIASDVRSGGGKIIGITMELTKHKAHKSADEMMVARTLSERKELMLKRADAIVALAGGIGTLDELTEMVALKRHDTHSKPIILLNTDNFYEGLSEQLKKMSDEGFFKSLKELDELIYFADTPEEAMQYIESYGD